MIKKQIFFFSLLSCASLSINGMEEKEQTNVNDLAANDFIKDCTHIIAQLNQIEKEEELSSSMDWLIHKIKNNHKKLYLILNTEEFQKIISMDFSQVDRELKDNLTISELKETTQSAIDIIAQIDALMKNKIKLANDEHTIKLQSLELAEQKISEQKRTENNKYRDTTNSLIKCKAELFHTLK